MTSGLPSTLDGIGMAFSGLVQGRLFLHWNVAALQSFLVERSEIIDGCKNAGYT
jgi:hypothetical protein